MGQQGPGTGRLLTCRTAEQQDPVREEGCLFGIDRALLAQVLALTEAETLKRQDHPLLGRNISTQDRKALPMSTRGADLSPSEPALHTLGRWQAWQSMEES